MTPPIILFPSSVQPSGVATHVFELARELKKRNIDVLVLCCDRGWLDNELRRNHIGYCYVHAKPTLIGLFRGNLSVYRMLKTISGPVILHLHGRLPLFCAILAQVLLPNVRQVCTVHQFREIASPGVLGVKNRLEAILLAWQKGVIAVSDSLRAELESVSGSRLKCIQTIPNFISNGGEYEGRCERDKDTCLRLVAIGRLSQEKGFDLLIRALREHVLEDIPLTLDIIGEGPLRAHLESLITEARQNDQVSLLGEVQAAARTLPNYDALVVPSRSESFGLVVLEAFRAGVPVIATNVPGLRDVASPDAALVVEPDSPTALALGIRALALNPALTHRLRQAGRKRLEDAFQPNRAVSSLISLYKEVLNTNSGSDCPS